MSWKNLFEKLGINRRHLGAGAGSPPEIPLPTDNYFHFASHPAPGIYDPMTVLPAAKPTFQSVPSLDFLAPGHERPRPVRTFDRHDTSLVEHCAEFFRPDRETQQF